MMDSVLFQVSQKNCVHHFLILPSKIHADAKNYLQYCRGKMATMSEMSLEVGLKFGFERNTSTNTGYQEKLHHK